MPHTLAPTLVALVGDRSDAVRAHGRIPVIVEALAATVPGARLEAQWLHSTSIGPGTDLTAFDGIWVVPGSPYEHVDGVLHAITVARTHAIPFLGTCGGFQHMMLEFAREVCGLGSVQHAETDPDAEAQLLVPLQCSLIGEADEVTVVEGTLAASIMGAGTTTERYFCSFGLNATYVDELERAGLVFGGHDAAGAMRLAELPGHPFYLGSLFQPELSSDSARMHPILLAFAAAARQRASSRRVTDRGEAVR